MKEAREFIMKCVFILTACVSIAAVVLICIFMFANGIPAITKVGPLNFLLGEKWKPMNNIFGILPMIVGSIYVTAGAIIIGVPIAFSHRYIWQSSVTRNYIKFSNRQWN